MLGYLCFLYATCVSCTVMKTWLTQHRVRTYLTNVYVQWTYTRVRYLLRCSCRRTGRVTRPNECVWCDGRSRWLPSLWTNTGAYVHMPRWHENLWRLWVIEDTIKRGSHANTYEQNRHELACAHDKQIRTPDNIVFSGSLHRQWDDAAKTEGESIILLWNTWKKKTHEIRR